MATGTAAHVTEVDDHVLLRRYADEASQEAFAELVRRHTSLVYGVCRRVLGDPEAAEDAAQAVFLVLMRKAGAIQPGQALGSWLHVTAHQAALQHRRSQLRRRRHEREAASMTTSDDDPRDDDIAAMRGALDEALELLPRMQRSAIILRYLQGKSQAEAASELGCSPETIHTHVTRALARLRQRLARRGPAMASVAVVAALTEAGAHAAPSGLHRVITGACLGGAKAAAGGGAAAEVARQLAVAAKWAAAKAVAVTLAAAVVVAAPVVVVARAAHAAPAPTAILRCHDLGVPAIAVAADGTMLTGSWDKSLRTWNARGERIASVAAHRDSIRRVALSADGALALSASADGTARLWRMPTLEPLATLTHGAQVTAVAFGGDGSLFTAGFDHVIRRWSRDGAPQAAYEAHTAEIWSLALSPDGTVLASAGDDYLAQLRDARTGAPLGELRGHTDCLRSIAFSPDGARVVTGGNDRTARIWDARDRRQLAVLAHPDLVDAVAWSPDGRCIATICQGRGPMLWRADGDGAPIALPQPGACGLAFTADGALRAGDADGGVRVWDARALADRLGR